MQGIKTVISKEFKRVFQDRKLIFSLFVLPVLIVIGMYGLMGMMEESMEEDLEQHIHRVYIQNAPKDLESIIGSVGYNDRADITYIDADEDVVAVEDGVLDETIDLFVVFDPDFDKKVSEYSQAGDDIPTVTVNYNSTANYSAVANSEFTSSVLSVLQQSVIASRIENLELLTAFETTTKEIVDEDKANGQVLAYMAPYLITILLFAGAMSLGVDAIAGEKERGTMARMLLTPVSRGQIAFGKLISLSLLSILSAIISAVAMITVLPQAMGASEDFSISFSGKQIFMLVCLMVVMVYLYVALIAFVSVIAKDVKVASSYVSPIYIVVMVTGMITMFETGGERAITSYMIPLYGNSLAIQDIMTNELTFANFGASIAVTLALAALATFGMTKAFNSEKVMFNA